LKVEAKEKLNVESPFTEVYFQGADVAQLISPSISAPFSVNAIDLRLFGTERS
jgi:hypothetical protein